MKFVKHNLKFSLYKFQKIITCKYYKIDFWSEKQHIPVQTSIIFLIRFLKLLVLKFTPNDRYKRNDSAPRKS
jgi:hypothetical protein